MASTFSIDKYGTIRKYKQGTEILHCEDGPAIEWNVGSLIGTKEWIVDGKWHRLDGPAIEHPSGAGQYWQNGKRHRIGGPAIICTDGAEEWWQNNKLHREDGPAFITASGNKRWYRNGKLHRLDGPASIWKDANGQILNHWYIDGIELSEEEFNSRPRV